MFFVSVKYTETETFVGVDPIDPLAITDFDPNSAIFPTV
jgi:hypothetical protein